MNLLKLFLGFLLGLIALALLWLAVVLSGWLPRPSQDELLSLELLNSDAASVSGKRNAFAALYLFYRDIPESEWESVAARDVERLNALLQPGKDPEGFEQLQDIHYATFSEMPTDREYVCEKWKSGCLDRVRADPEAARSAAALGRDQLERGEMLANYDHYRSLVEPRLDAPPNLFIGRYVETLLTAAALNHIDGDSAAALARLCGATATWRRLRSNTDDLLIDMVGISIILDSAALTSEILAELPADVSLPCMEAFSPLTNDEFDQCPAFTREYRGLKNAMRDVEHADESMPLRKQYIRAALVRLHGLDHLNRIAAQNVGQMCGSQHVQRIGTRSADALPRVEPCSLTARLFNPWGCSRASMAELEPDFKYHRVLDLDAGLRLFGTVLWLRRHSDVDPKAAFESRPASLRSAHHDFEIDVDSSALRMRTLAKRPTDVWSIPYATPRGESGMGETLSPRQDRH